MITVSDALRAVLARDEAHLECLKAGTLNLRAYAALVLPEIEKMAKKQVKLGSIVMALSRLERDLDTLRSLRPAIRIEGLSVKAGLTVVNYEKTSQIISTLSQASIKRNDKDFFVISESLAEIAIIAPDQSMNAIEQLVQISPKSKFTNAVAITLRFDEYYITVPNVLYAFVSTLATKRINLLEIVSTLTEVSFILEDKYMDDAVDSFKVFLK